MTVALTYWRIVAPHFVCFVVVGSGRVVEAAPILGWAEGRPWSELRSYARRRGWSGTPFAPRVCTTPVPHGRT